MLRAKSQTITIKQILKIGGKIRNLSAKKCKESTTFKLYCCWFKHVRPQNTNTNNVLFKHKERAQQEYTPEDPESEPSSSDSSSSESNSPGDNE